MVKQLETRKLFRKKNIRAYNKAVHGYSYLEILNENEHEEFKQWVNRNGIAKSKPIAKIHFITESILTVTAHDLSQETIDAVTAQKESYKDTEQSNHLYHRQDILDIAVPRSNKELRQIQVRLRKSKSQFFCFIY